MSSDDGWDRDKPWTAPAQQLVLYRAESEWRFAIYSAGGILDGCLPGVDRDADESDAMAALLENVSSTTGRGYIARWEPTDPDFWTAAVEVVPERPL